MTIAYNSNYDETIPFSDTTIQVNCALNVEQTYTVPGTPEQLYQAYFSYTQNGNVFVRKNAIPTIPGSGTVGSQPYSEFRPGKRYVKGGDVLHFITSDANAFVGLSLRKLQG